MKIVIAGAGAVGFHLVRELGAEGHNIALIDVNPERLEHVRDRIDVLTVAGTATSRQALESAGTKDCDMFIAVSDKDEVNILACAAAHAMGVKRTLARVRNRDFTNADRPLVDWVRLGVTRFINPDEVAVDSVVALVDAPGSIDVGDFAGGEILLRSFRVEEETAVVGKPLERLRQDFAGVQFLVAAIQRGDQHIIPDGQDRLEPGDRAYMIMTRDSLPVFRRIVAGRDVVQRVVVYGAERFGISVAGRLQERTKVVLIDEDETRCTHAAALLDNTLVLHGSPNDSDVQGQGKLASADFFIAASNNEEHNLILAMLAKKRGAKRNIVVTADPDLTLLLDRLDIDAVINPRLTMVGRLLRFARGGRVKSVQKLGESAAEVIEMVVRSGARAAGRTLREMNLPEGLLVGAVKHDDEAFVPHGNTRVEEGDTVVTFVLPGLRDRAERMFARRGVLHFAESGKIAPGRTATDSGPVERADDEGEGGSAGEGDPASQEPAEQA
ncbi:MAG: Trk system potassium transporter TrkA [Planctomycetota bacterium]|jgi:trk system potassium uptake protein TrkA